MSVCDRKCVILQTKRARYALNKEIFDLLNEERVSGARSGRLVYNFDEKSTASVRKVSRPLKCHSKFWGTHTYTHIFRSTVLAV